MRVALIAALLALCGCCPTPAVVRPNPALTLDCDYPLIEGETWRALAEAYEQRGEALKECNRRMRALRGESPGG